MSNLKPGFEKKYENFRKFLKKEKYYGNQFDEAKEIITKCQRVVK